MTGGIVVLLIVVLALVRLIQRMAWRAELRRERDRLCHLAEGRAAVRPHGLDWDESYAAEQGEQPDVPEAAR